VANRPTPHAHPTPRLSGVRVIALIDDPRLVERSFATSAPGTGRLPACPLRVPQGPTPTNLVTTSPLPRTTRMRSPTENCSLPGRFGAGLLPATGLFVPGPPQNPATSRALPGRSAPANCQRQRGQAKTARRMPRLSCGRLWPCLVRRDRNE
jgi:hypothetical protein